MSVLFVGSNPSKKNVAPEIAFLGTPSHKVLPRWIDFLEATDYNLINVTDAYVYSPDANDLERLRLATQNHKAVVALGNLAAKALSTLHVEHAKLPHPSPRNRRLNDPWFIVEQLLTVRAYLESLKH